MNERNYVTERRDRFIERGYRQIEAYLPEDVHARVKIAVAMFDDMHQINDVVEVAVRDWLDRNKVPHPRSR